MSLRDDIVETIKEDPIPDQAIERLLSVKQNYPSPSDDTMKKLAIFRLGKTESAPQREWIDPAGNIISFKRGITPKEYKRSGLLMSRLSGLIRYLFYDHMTLCNYPLEGSLKRKYAVCEDIEFIKLLQFEWATNTFHSAYIPHSLEYIARIYKHLLQKVIYPEINENLFMEGLRSIFTYTFGILKHSADIKGENSESKKIMDIESCKSYVQFRKNITLIEAICYSFVPKDWHIKTDLSEYKLEKMYAVEEWRMQHIREILIGKSK